MRDHRSRLQTLLRNKGEGLRARSAAPAVAEIYLYDEIGMWGITAADFAQQLRDLGTLDEIRLHVNSLGGDTYDGIAIVNLLRSHPARVVVTVDGLAASAASFIAQAGEEIVMARNSEMMIHDAWGICVGNAADMRDLGERLDGLSDNVASIYAERAGGTVADWRTAMLAETWYSAQEAVDAGLADRVDAKADDTAKSRFDLSIFNYAGRAQAPKPSTPAAASASGPTETPEESMTLTNEHAASLRSRLGIADETADGDTILAALDEALDEQVTDPPADPPAAVTVDTPAAPAEPSIPDEVRAELVRQSEELAALKAQNAAKSRTTFFDGLLDTGRLKPADRATWESRYDRSPEGASMVTEILSNRAANSEVPLAEIGHGGTEPEVAEDYWFPGSYVPTRQEG